MPDHRRATAERNAEAILDATEALLARGAPASTSAVAAEAGVSRVTVYAHFPTREALLEAVAERVVKRAVAAIDAANINDGPPLEALERLIAAAWGEIERNRAVATAASEQLSPAALNRSHAALHEPIGALIRRGQQEGAFRTDLPAGWLVASYFSLMHACGDEVRNGRIGADEAVPILQATLRSVFTG
ncbi:MAG TPA: TetR/AcrR family transcriptional regulator [Solirubrobacter sp.]|jgi:AcrR family transcriptional regulator|nr:TetR/AcrR family transcriptional regulator [Solirubrobacter sp.]